MSHDSFFDDDDAGLPPWDPFVDRQKVQDAPPQKVDAAPVPENLSDLFGTTVAATEAVNVAAKLYLESRRRKADAEKAAKDRAAEATAAEAALIEKLKEAKLLAVTVKDVTGRSERLAMHKIKLFSLSAGLLDDPGVYGWLKEVGGADLVKRTINYQTFGAFCRELDEAKKTIHPLVKVVDHEKIRKT